MPITLPPISRRRLLGGSLAAGFASLLPRHLLAADTRALDPHRIALLSDVHINAKKDTLHGKTVKPWDNLVQAVQEILALENRPANVLVNGDCAYMTGQAGDYKTFVEGIDPIRKAGLPVHLVLGNHDSRVNFFAGVEAADTRVKAEPVADRMVSMISLPRANLLLLDSLDATNKTPGVMGEKQLAWLAKTLDDNASKPAILFIHHQPDDPADRAKTKKALSGLIDTDALMDVILPRKQVKAYVFGHTHVWKQMEREGLHLINLPTTAWIFAAAQPRGWTDLRLREDGATFELHALDPKHASHGQKFECKWR